MPQYILATVLGLMMATIALLQWRTNHNRLKLELYDRRYKVYQAVMDLLLHLEKGCCEGGVDIDAALNDFIKKTVSHHFLFKPDIDEFRDDLIERAGIWYANCEEENELLLKNWFKETPKIFRPYLDFSKL